MPLPFFAWRRDRPTVDVSVVVPVYNHARYIESTLLSVLGQTVEVREIVCVDDGSTDDSFAIVERLATRHASIRAWSRPNQGASRTIDEGIAAARGKYVAILNSDDRFAPERIERCVLALETSPRAVLACTAVSFIDGEGTRFENPWYEDALAFRSSCTDLATSLAYANFLVSTSNFVAEKSTFVDFGGFRNLRYTHDLEFLMRVLALGREIVIVDRPLLHYRVHAKNTIAESLGRVRVELAAVFATHLRRRTRDAANPPTRDELAFFRRACESNRVSSLVTHFLAQPDDPTLDPTVILGRSDSADLVAMLDP